MRATGAVRLRVARRIEADPAGTALLLAGPAALELWPAPRGLAGRGVVVAEPPHRTPTAFVTRFSWTGPDLPAATGVLRLSYVPAGQGMACTAAELVLDVAAREAGDPDDDALQAIAEGFLANLARAAQDRRAA